LIELILRKWVRWGDGEMGRWREGEWERWGDTVNIIIAVHRMEPEFVKFTA